MKGTLDDIGWGISKNIHIILLENETRLHRRSRMKTFNVTAHREKNTLGRNCKTENQWDISGVHLIPCTDK